MQLGFTLIEKMQFDAEGQLRNASLAEYKIPGLPRPAARDGQRGGGRGAAQRPVRRRRAWARPRTFGVSPAIANAIHDAVGVRLTELPLTPEAVYHGDAEEMRKEIRFRLNGEAVSAQVAPHENLVEVLRDAFGLYGARESCGQGLCGCCTVLVDGTRGLRLPLSGHPCVKTPKSRPSKAARRSTPCRRRSSRRAAFQCGFCTPGFILMTRQLLDEIPQPSEDEIKHYLSGNLCRCAAYPQIIEAVQLGREETEEGMKDSCSRAWLFAFP